MLRSYLAVLILLPAAAIPQVVQPGGWDVRSTVAEFSVPGVPAFLARMARGKSKAEHKQLSAGQGIETLLAPDPKAQCRVDSQRIADGRYAQALTCPQKRGQPIHITRAGSYDTSGFLGRATVIGTTPKGMMSIVLNQHAVRVAD